MSLNYCCHDDYTLTGQINSIDTNILVAYQMYLQANSNTPPPDIPTFLTFYNTQVNAKAVASLGNKTIEHLPTLESDENIITSGGLVPKCVSANVEKLWISFTGNGAYSDWYELETDEEEDFTKFKIATADYGTSLQNWAIGKATNLQGINITSSINQPSSTELTEDQKAKTFNSDLLGFGCDGDFNNNHGVNVQQVNMRIKAYDNQNSEVTKKYGSDDNTHGYVSEGTPWEGSNMVYRTTTFNSLVIDNSGKNSIDIDYIYFIKETNEDEKIKFSAVSPPNKTCGVWS